MKLRNPKGHDVSVLTKKNPLARDTKDEHVTLEEVAMNHALIFTVFLALPRLPSLAIDGPNFLWISSEDNRIFGVDG